MNNEKDSSNPISSADWQKEFWKTALSKQGLVAVPVAVAVGALLVIPAGLMGARPNAGFAYGAATAGIKAARAVFKKKN